MKDLQASGEWWLPGQGNRHLYGTLRSDQSGSLTLETLDAFVDVDFSVAAYTPLPIVLGTADGKHFTLEGVWAIRDTSTATAYRVEHAFVGEHIDSVGSLLFDRAVVQYSDLPEWVNAPALNLSFQKASGLRLEVRYRDLEAKEVVLDDGSKIRFTSGTRTDQDRLRSITIHQEYAIELVLARPLTMETLVRGFSWPLQTLVTLGVGRPQRITSLRLHRPDTMTSSEIGRAHV